jgi:hypothetical protein
VCVTAPAIFAHPLNKCVKVRIKLINKLRPTNLLRSSYIIMYASKVRCNAKQQPRSLAHLIIMRHPGPMLRQYRLSLSICKFISIPVITRQFVRGSACSLCPCFVRSAFGASASRAWEVFRCIGACYRQMPQTRHHDRQRITSQKTQWTSQYGNAKTKIGWLSLA